VSEEQNNSEPKLENLYSYHPEDVTYRDKLVVKEVIKFLTENQNKSFDDNKQSLLDMFHIEKTPEKSVEDSLWYKLTKHQPIGMSPQGHRVYTENGKKIRVPYLGFSADINVLDKMLLELLEQLKDKASK
jgi:hypothetical protein